MMRDESNSWSSVSINVSPESVLAGCSELFSSSALFSEDVLADEPPNPFNVLIASLQRDKKDRLIDSGLDRLSSLLILALLSESDRTDYLTALSSSEHKEDKQFLSVFNQLLRRVDLRAGPLLVERYLQGYMNYLQGVIDKAAEEKKPTYTIFLAAVSEFKKTVCEAWQESDAPWLQIEEWASGCDRSGSEPLWFFDRLAKGGGLYCHPVATENSGQPDGESLLTVG